MTVIGWFYNPLDFGIELFNHEKGLLLENFVCTWQNLDEIHRFQIDRLIGSVLQINVKELEIFVGDYNSENYCSFPVFNIYS